ncbi:MAG: carbon-nitrogen hydrolase family protein [Litorilituus sp.]|jgi:predicted amidohydrolase|nr:carbon-nitrogen hydrolase family protein [Litorilituus sp.]
MVKISAIQLTAKPNVADNLQTISAQLKKITLDEQGQDIEHLVVLPECCLFFGANDKEQLKIAHENKIALTAVANQFESKLQVALSELARQYQVYLVAGTIPLLTSKEHKFTNSSCIFSPKGEVLGRYDKIHLFDVNVKDNQKSYCESRYAQAGTKPCLVHTPIASIGLSICFDLRFPSLYQTLNKLGADIITVPSAFTRITGKAHWQTLLQARAIENQVYIVAAGQEGVHANGRETWGHSMIISPWGEVITCLEHGEGYISANFLPEEINRIRASMPLNSPLF